MNDLTIKYSYGDTNGFHRFTRNFGPHGSGMLNCREYSRIVFAPTRSVTGRMDSNPTGMIIAKSSDSGSNNVGLTDLISRSEANLIFDVIKEAIRLGATMVEIKNGRASIVDAPTADSRIASHQTNSVDLVMQSQLPPLTEKEQKAAMQEIFGHRHAPDQLQTSIDTFADK